MYCLHYNAALRIFQHPALPELVGFGFLPFVTFSTASKHHLPPLLLTTKMLRVAHLRWMSDYIGKVLFFEYIHELLQRLLYMMHTRFECSSLRDMDARLEARASHRPLDPCLPITRQYHMRPARRK